MITLNSVTIQKKNINTGLAEGEPITVDDLTTLSAENSTLEAGSLTQVQDIPLNEIHSVVFA